MKLVFDLTKKIETRALSEKIPTGIPKRDYIVKILYEELSTTLGSEKKFELNKVTTSLLNRQVVFLDGVANDIRANSGKVVKRTAIIRALIDALELSNIDLTDITSEDACRQVLLHHLTASQIIENNHFCQLVEFYFFLYLNKFL